MTKLDIYIDGASKGNPGPSGVGAVIYQNNQILKNISAYIGTATNNFAEYTALIYALKEALLIKADTLNINTDSQLLYRQLKKEYAVKSLNIIGLYKEALHLLSEFKQVSINHIPREKNKCADRLATQAVNLALVKDIDRETGSKWLPAIE